MPIKEFNYRKVLDGLSFTHEQFVDLCILMGCDYCDTIRGIGMKRALELVREHKTIERIIEKLDKDKYPVPENWMYKEARGLFLNPEIIDAETIELKWTEPNEEGLVDYMVKEKGFNEERMRNGVKKILKSRNTGTQVRLDSFFKVTTNTAASNASPTNKRKTEDVKENDKKKAKKAGATGFKRPK